MAALSLIISEELVKSEEIATNRMAKTGTAKKAKLYYTIPGYQIKSTLKRLIIRNVMLMVLTYSKD